MAELYHHGIKGMHWGVRRFQNADGSLTQAGKKRYDGDKGSKNFYDDMTRYKQGYDRAILGKKAKQAKSYSDAVDKLGRERSNQMTKERKSGYDQKLIESNNAKMDKKIRKLLGEFADKPIKINDKTVFYENGGRRLGTGKRTVTAFEAVKLDVIDATYNHHKF